MSIGDGECNAVNNNAACGYDGGDCCLCSCSGAACESNNFDCLDPNAGDETFDCSEPPTFPVCSPQTRRTWIVDNSAQAGVLADAVNCSGGSFEVEWRGNVTVHQPIYVVGGTVLTVSGADTGAVMDGDHQTRLFVVINGTLVVSNTDVFSGRGNAGGAIVAVRSVLTFNRTSFVRNGAENGNGGAMHISDGSSVSIVGGKFEYNSAHTRGGAVFVSDSSMVSYNTAWINNYSAFDGGAAYVTTNSNVSLSAAEFVDNFGSGSGGAIFLHTGSLVTIGGGIFRSNFALSDGGAVGSSVLDSANNPANSGLVIRGVATFDGNSCGGNGGALALLGGISVDISTAGINFLHNMANVAGGAIFVSGIGVGPVFENASFVSNSAVIGGAVSIVASGTAATVADPSYSTTFDRCRFIDNRAERTGGAIDTAAGRDAFANSVFERNRASTGGALRLAGTTAAISNCSFVDNMSDDREGTAISNDGYFSTMEELYFSGNVFDCPETMYLGYIAVSGDFLGVLSTAFMPRAWFLVDTFRRLIVTCVLVFDAAT